LKKKRRGLGREKKDRKEKSSDYKHHDGEMGEGVKDWSKNKPSEKKRRGEITILSGEGSHQVRWK